MSGGFVLDFSHESKAPTVTGKRSREGKVKPKVTKRREENEEGEEKVKERKKKEKEAAIDKACLEEIAAGVGVGAEELKESPEWVPTSLDGIDWKEIDAKEEEETTDRTYCFLCRFSQSTADGANVYFTEMMEFIKGNYHCMELLTFLGDVQEMYNKNLRPYLQVPEEERLPWYRSMIYLHITMHAPTQHVATELNLKRVLTLTEQMSNNGVYLTDKRSGKSMVDKHSVKTLLDLMKYSDSLFSKVCTLRPTTHL
jgi:hypothetical protein